MTEDDRTQGQVGQAGQAGAEKTDFERLQPSTQQWLIEWYMGVGQQEAVEDLLNMIPTAGLHRILRDIHDVVGEVAVEDYQHQSVGDV